jgi:hypothetical protein
VRLEPGRVVPWRLARVAIDPWTILRLARYRRRDHAPAPVWDATRAMAVRAEELAQPAARLRVVHVETVAPARVTLTEGPSFTGQDVARHLAGAPRAIAFVLTLGPALETDVIALGERQESLEAYLLDLAGWAGLEAAVRALRQELARALPRDRVSHRLGPGHRDWPLTEQQGLMSLFGDDAGSARGSTLGFAALKVAAATQQQRRGGGQRLAVALDHVHQPQEGEHGQAAGVPRGPAGGQHVVRAGQVIPERDRRVPAGEHRARVGHPGRQLGRVPGLDLQVLGRPGVADG